MFTLTRNAIKSFLSILILSIAAVSCREKFTEEDLLKAQQEIDLAVYVVDLSDVSKPPVVNATVTISQGDQNLSQTTDSNGIALFKSVKLGGFVYTISAENYLIISGTDEIDPSSFRVSQGVVEIGTYSLNNPSILATVKGRVTIETDVTNTIREDAPNIPVTLSTVVNNKTFSFQGRTDAQGRYEIIAPIIEGSNGLYRLSVPDIELDQTIALNKYEDEIGTFFQQQPVLPRIEQIPTIFSVFRRGLDPARSAVPISVRSMYALADVAPSGGTRAVISQVITNALGEVTSLAFFSGGDYTNDADGIVRIEVFGLAGGSGAIFDVPLNGQSDLSLAFNAALFSAAISVPAGTGYPPGGNNFNLNTILERPGSEAGLFSGGFLNVTLSQGAMVYREMDYGTGISRERILQ